MDSGIPEGDEGFVTVEAAAKLTGFPTRTVVRWAEQGWIPSIVRDGRRYMRKADIEAMTLRSDEHC
jgi:excisionase family DNA binding protein